MLLSNVQAEHYLIACSSRSRSPFLDDMLLVQVNHKNYNFLDCDWFKKSPFSTNSLTKLLLDSLLLDSLSFDSLLLDSTLSDSSINQSHSEL